MAEARHLPGKFVWFELRTTDVKRAQAFYAEVVGWSVKTVPIGRDAYEMICVGETSVGGYHKPQPGGHSRWLSYVSVEDVDRAAKLVEENGGKVLVAPHDLGEVGRSAHIQDPEGAELHLFRNAVADIPDADATQGMFFWDELHTTDPESAVSFYENVVGYRRRTMDMGPAGKYHALELAGRARGGVTGHRAEERGPHWLPYVFVDDPDAASERAKENGGKILVGPMDIPGVGRSVVVEDPTGAIIALMKPNPRTI